MKDYLINVGTKVEIELSQFSIKPASGKYALTAHHLITKNEQLKYYEEFIIGIPHSILKKMYGVYGEETIVIDRLDYPKLFSGVVIHITINDSTGNRKHVDRVYKKQSSCKFVIELGHNAIAIIPQNLVNKL